MENNLGVKWGTVKLISFQNSWKQAFDLEKVSLINQFSNEIIDIQHIGSTAIDAISAKPIIDIAVQVESINSVEKFIPYLENQAYFERAGRFQGPQRVFMKKNELGNGAKSLDEFIITHHIHFIEKGLPEWDKKILFRDIINSSAELRNEYEQLKMDLYSTYQNQRKPYTAGKTDFISQVLSFENVLNYLRYLSYGRNSKRDFNLVLKERRGTCSTKHAYAKWFADNNDIDNVVLILCIFKMNVDNTPEIAPILRECNLEYIPEAHCYLEWNNELIDITKPNSDFSNIENNILIKEEIHPQQIGQYKVNFHKEFMTEWIKNENISYSLNELWHLREQCITQLSYSNS